MLCTVTHQHTQSSSCVKLQSSYFVRCVWSDTHFTMLEAPQVPFLTCTLEIPQKLFAAQVLALNILLV